MNEETQAFINATWELCGSRVRPMKKWVFVRTELLPDYIGKVFIPASCRGNYTDLPHVVFMEATVLSTGPECTAVKTGDKIMFSRLFFARWQYMPDKTLVGWVDEANIMLGDSGLD